MIQRWLTHNIGLKIIALALAMITWIYVKGEMIK